jgi:hypothetical protein
MYPCVDACHAHTHGMDYPVIHKARSSTIPIMGQTGWKGAQDTGTEWIGKKKRNTF